MNSLAELIKDLNKASHILMEIPDTTFRRPHENGDLVNSLATLIKNLNKVSHIFMEIPDIATRFRDDEVFSEQFWDDDAFAAR